MYEEGKSKAEDAVNSRLSLIHRMKLQFFIMNGSVFLPFSVFDAAEEYQPGDCRIFFGDDFYLFQRRCFLRITFHCKNRSQFCMHTCWIRQPHLPWTSRIEMSIEKVSCVKRRRKRISCHRNQLDSCQFFSLAHGISRCEEQNEP